MMWWQLRCACVQMCVTLTHPMEEERERSKVPLLCRACEQLLARRAREEVGVEELTAPVHKGFRPQHTHSRVGGETGGDGMRATATWAVATHSSVWKAMSSFSPSRAACQALKNL